MTKRLTGGLLIRRSLCCFVVGLAACSSPADQPNGSPSTSSKHAAQKSAAAPPTPQPFTGSFSSAQRASANIPARLGIPSSASPLLTDLPGRAVLSMVRLDRTFSAEGFADHTVYIYGLDGRWRMLNMAELGLPAREWYGPDGSGLGVLSPDGRYLAFNTKSRAGVLDLETGRFRLHQLKAGETPGAHKWTLWGSLLVGSSKSSFSEYRPMGGRVRSYPAALSRVETTPDGRFAYAHGSGSSSVVSYLDSAWKLLDEVSAPYAAPVAPGNYSVSRVMYFDDSLARDDPEPVEDGSSVVVADATTLVPSARLTWPPRRAMDSVDGWTDDDSFLLRSDRTLFVWRPSEQRILSLARAPRSMAISIAIDVVEVADPVGP